MFAAKVKPPELPEAIGCYRAAVALRPDSPGTLYNIGNALYRMGQLNQAIACYREANRRKQDYAEAHVNLGRLLAL
jgi:tetratricopeptide (TPR) repeat protein